MDNFLSIGKIARGAALEKLDVEIAKVIENIMDINTPATAKRKLTINIVFAPSDSRNEAELEVNSRLFLAPTNSVSTRIYMDKKGDDLYVGELVKPKTMPGQESINAEGEQQSSPLYKVK